MFWSAKISIQVDNKNFLFFPAGAIWEATASTWCYTETLTSPKTCGDLLSLWGQLQLCMQQSWLCQEDPVGCYPHSGTVDSDTTHD